MKRGDFDLWLQAQPPLPDDLAPLVEAARLADDMLFQQHGDHPIITAKSRETKAALRAALRARGIVH